MSHAKVNSAVVNTAFAVVYRVNGAAIRSVWTSLIPSSFPPKHVSTFGSDVPIGMAGQPDETAPSCVFPASYDSLYMTGQVVLYPNGGEIVNG